MPKLPEIRHAYSRDVGRRGFLRIAGLGLAASVGAPSLAACGRVGGNAGFPSRPVQLIVAYEPGGGTDVGARILQPFLEEALDGEVQIINLPGGGGWVGWNELVNADPDGHTIGFINTPNFMTGYLDPRLGRTDIGPESFTLIGNQVTDYGAIAISPSEDRFDDITGFMEYALEHELIVTSTGVGSDDHFASLQLSDMFDCRFAVLHNEGAADSISDLLGGNVDAVFANVGEVKAQHDAGEIKVIAVMKDDAERSPYLEDVPTLTEAGFTDVASWSSRGIAAPAGLDPDVTSTLIDACRAAVEHPDHVEQLAAQGLEVDYLAPDAYSDMVDRDDSTARRLGETYIWGDNGT